MATAGTLTFTGTAGEAQTVAVEVVGDLVVEDDETFTVELGTPSNPDVTITDGSGLGTLVNDDEGPIFELTKEILDYYPGSDHVDYLLRITNIGSVAQGDDPSSNELEDVLPDGLELLSADSDSPTSSAPPQSRCCDVDPGRLHRLGKVWTGRARGDRRADRGSAEGDLPRAPDSDR